jgi:hypothetical protein
MAMMLGPEGGGTAQAVIPNPVTPNRINLFMVILVSRKSMRSI